MHISSRYLQQLGRRRLCCEQYYMHGLLSVYGDSSQDDHTETLMHSRMLCRGRMNIHTIVQYLIHLEVYRPKSIRTALSAASPSVAGSPGLSATGLP